MGTLFSQSGSFLAARKHTIEQARKAMILLFTRINNLDIPIDLQFKLFDYTVLPILTYACEIWGFENIDIIEKIQNDFLRKVTLAKKSTPIYMLYGELGRIPIQIIIKSRLIGFWNRLLHGRQFKLSYLIYQCLYHSNINSKWITCVKDILTEIGRPDVWNMQEQFHSHSLSAYVKRRLTDQYIQQWFGKAEQSSKALTYYSFKSEFSIEKYLLILPKQLRVNLYKFRTGNHKLPVETGRWDGTHVSDRKCLLCTTNDIGDEFHYLFKCPYFQTERKTLIKKYFIIRPNMIKFGQLLNTTNKTMLTNLSKFVNIILKCFK